MLNEWLAVEHNRIHVMEQWPEGPMKEAGLAAARSALKRLAADAPPSHPFVCSTCAARNAESTCSFEMPRAVQ